MEVDPLRASVAGTSASVAGTGTSVAGTSAIVAGTSVAGTSVAGTDRVKIQIYCNSNKYNYNI